MNCFSENRACSVHFGAKIKRMGMGKKGGKKE
jgi:hypothetical protein